jgi:Domain of unknown function (DUF3784)
MIIVAIIFILLGILIKNGKMYNLIAGYNTMTEKEKEKINVLGIAILMRNVFFGMAIIILVGYLISKWTENSRIEIISLFVAILIGVPYLLVKSNTEKYKQK